jgi:hypothetical protein
LLSARESSPLPVGEGPGVRDRNLATWFKVFVAASHVSGEESRFPGVAVHRQE